MRIVFKPMGVALLIVAMGLILGVVLLQQQQLKKVRQSIAVAAPPAPAIPVVDRSATWNSPREGVYRIRSVSSGMFLGTKNASTDPNIEAHISQGKWFDKANQKWRLLRMTDGTFNIQNEDQGHWLDNSFASLKSGDYVRQWFEVNRTTNDAQKWQIIRQPTGDYQIRNVASGKALEIHGGSEESGGLVYQEDWKGEKSQKFTFEPISD